MLLKKKVFKIFCSSKRLAEIWRLIFQFISIWTADWEKVNNQVLMVANEEERISVSQVSWEKLSSKTNLSGSVLFKS